MGQRVEGGFLGPDSRALDRFAFQVTRHSVLGRQPFPQQYVGGAGSSARPVDR